MKIARLVNPSPLLSGCRVGVSYAGLAVILSSTMLFTGCKVVAPKMPANLAAPAIIGYDKGAFDQDVSDYHASLKGSNFDLAKRQRDQIVYRILAQIDAEYGKFEVTLSVNRAGAQTAGDAAILGLTAASTVVGSADIKTILSATATAFTGTRLSFDKNYFEQKTTEALVSQMRATRATLKDQFLKSLGSRDVNSYPLEAAWSDLLNYYYAGTIPSALTEIASKAGGDAVTATNNLSKTIAKLTPATAADAADAISIRSEYDALSSKIDSGKPAEIAEAAVMLKKILYTANITFDSSAPAAELLTAMHNAMVAADNDTGKFTALTAAVKSATATHLN